MNAGAVLSIFLICRSRDFQYGVSWQQNDDSMFSYMMSDSDENFENTIARKTRKTKALKRRRSGERFGAQQNYGGVSSLG